MGIVNVTPDSFSDGGRFLNKSAAIDHALTLVDQGADIIDIGGESSRPNALAVPDEEEIRRVIPVIEGLASRVSIPISVDTYKASVAERAIEAGASIVNDIGALRLDAKMGGVVAAKGAAVVLMHMLETPQTMQRNPVYKDVAAEVTGFLADAIVRAQDAGIDRRRIIVDPGIGFGKTVEHNLLLMQQIQKIVGLGVAVLVGPSRKSFISKLLLAGVQKQSPDFNPELEPVLDHVRDPEIDQNQRELGTQASVSVLAACNAHIVRVHDVARTRATLTIVDAIRNAKMH